MVKYLFIFFFAILSGCDDALTLLTNNPPNQRRVVQEPNLDCREECKPGYETVNCLYLSGSVSRPDYKERISSFVEIVSSSNGETIPISRVMKLFDSAVDPCSRGDLITTKDATFTNLSEKFCTLEYASGPFGGVSVIIPKRLSGQVVVESQSKSIVFPGKDARADFKFQNTDLDADYGGYVREIDITNSAVLVDTGSACLAAPI